MCCFLGEVEGGPAPAQGSWVYFSAVALLQPFIKEQKNLHLPRGTGPTNYVAAPGAMAQLQEPVFHDVGRGME